MGKCGAITRKGTPCKLPGTHNGRCWLHEDKHASAFQDDLETKPRTNKDNFDFSDENNSGFADRSESLLAIQETSESNEELSLDMLDTPDVILSEDGFEFEEELSFDLLDTPDGILSEGDSESNEELSLDMMDTPDGILSEGDSESNEELSLDMLDTPGVILSEDDSESNEELSLDMMDTPDGILSEDDSESNEELSLDMLDTPDGIISEDGSEFEEELSLDMMDTPDGIISEGDSESNEELSLDMMDTPGVILSEDAYEDFLRKSESDLMPESEIDEPAKETYEFDEELSLEGVRDGEGRLSESRTCVENNNMGDLGKVHHKLDSTQDLEETEIPVQKQGQDKKTLVSTNGYKESAEIDLLEKSPHNEKKQENDSNKKKGVFISFYTLGAIIFLIALILLTLYKT